MSIIQSVFSSILLACTIVLSSGCAQTLSVQVLRPAEINLKGIKKIAIGEITGRGGTEVAGELTTALFDSGRYEVVDRQNLDKVLLELRLSSSSLVEPETAVKAGKLLGASAVVVGSIVRHSYREEPLRKNDSERTNLNNVKEYFTRYVRSGSAHVSASFRVTDLSTGQVIASRTIEEHQTEELKGREVPRNTDPNEAVPDPIDGEALLGKARAAVIARFMKAIAPYYESLELPFEKTGALPDLERGIALAKANDWSRAVELFSSAVGKAGSLPPKKQAYAYLDLGMAQCFGLGDFKSGIQAISQALTLQSKNDWINVRQMCERRRSDAARLADQGVQ
jgi:curli biogenesis system outer membrane secretion channel CsgG